MTPNVILSESDPEEEMCYSTDYVLHKTKSVYTSLGGLQPASEGQPFYGQPAISIYMTAGANPGQPFLPGNPSREPG